MVWGWIGVSICCICIAAGMAELVRAHGVRGACATCPHPRHTTDSIFSLLNPLLPCHGGEPPGSASSNEAKRSPPATGRLCPQASAYPTSGGMYYWVYQLLDPKYGRFVCWVNGACVACSLHAARRTDHVLAHACAPPSPGLSTLHVLLLAPRRLDEPVGTNLLPGE